MKNNRISSAVLLFFLIAAVNPVFSVEEENLLRAGVCKIIYTGSAADNLSGGISNSLFETVSDITERRITNEEISAILTSRKQELLKTKRLELEKLYTERDLLLFSSSLEFLLRDLKVKDQLIESKEIEIAQIIEELDRADSDVTEEDFSILPIEMAVPENGNLFDLKPGKPADTAEAYNLDLMIFGFIEELEDYYFIELIVWNNIIGREIGVWKTVLKIGDLKKEVQPGFDELRAILLGREWAGLIVNSSANSMIYIDDIFSGISRVESRLLEPGEHRVAVRRAGYESLEKVIELDARLTAEIELDTQAVIKREIIFQSYPQGADLYLDSVWMGKTPLRAEIYNFPAAVRLSKEGWEDKEFFVEKNSDNLIDINLKPESPGRTKWVEDQRSRFYGSLGAFVMSIPVTALCYAGIEQTALAYNGEYAANGTTNIDELKRLSAINKGLYAAYLGSLGLNIILFFDTIINAVDYVGSVDYVSE